MRSSNVSRDDPSFAYLPPNLLEAFVPGFGSISAFLFEAFGFDITIWVSAAFVIFAAAKSFDWLQRQAYSIILRWGTCSISFDSQSDAYYWIVEYLSAKGIGASYHDLIAISDGHVNPSATHQVEYEIDGEVHSMSDPPPRTGPKVIYEPSIGSTQYFWFNGRLFVWHRWHQHQQSMLHTLLPETIRGRIYCFARTTYPIKSLVQEAMKLYEKQTANKTTIRRPAASHQRRRGGNPWIKVTTRLSRSLDSVIIDQEAKTRVIADMSGFLSLNTKKWYADRGIPYRRGYLFSGPPGTGKTSLSFALAGAFGLNIYCISLAEPSLTEEDLARLFDSLPEQCLVLLEDIDVAGLPVRDAIVKTDTTTVSSNLEDEIFSLDETKDANRLSGSSIVANNMHISLSGLLNVIDGVAANEGRILIMTTNNISRLDKALLRPGRIDHKLDFQLASKSDVAAMFHQIYRDRTATDLKMDAPLRWTEQRNKAEDRIETLAEAFSLKFPNRTFGQAEIQGFLMQYKDDPDAAILRIDGWLEGKLTVPMS